MNHDATHCMDYKETCGKVCYRARLTADLQQRGDLQGLPMSWATKDKVEVCIETTPEVQTITVRPFEPLRYGCPFQGTCERSAE